MSDEYHQLGETVSLDKLSYKLAIAFIKAVKKHRFARFRRAFKENESEGVEFECKPETVQFPVEDIQKSERLCAIFGQSDFVVPKVLALRKNFPRNLLHVNLTEDNVPISLCLFENYEEDRLILTPERLVQKIFEWLRRAALGELHLQDQPLEPFLLNPLVVIVGNEVVV